MEIHNIGNIEYDTNSTCVELIDAQDKDRHNHIFINEQLTVTVIIDVHGRPALDVDC